MGQGLRRNVRVGDVALEGDGKRIASLDEIVFVQSRCLSAHLVYGA